MIRGVQEAMSCCGLKDMADRAWPVKNPKACAGIYGFTTSCGKELEMQVEGMFGELSALALVLGIVEVFINIHL